MALMKFLCEGHLFYSSNLFIISALSAAVGDFYGYSHDMAALPVIFSTIEQCSQGRQKLYFTLKFKLGALHVRHLMSCHANQ